MALVREQIKKKSIELQGYQDPDNTADVLMKQLMPEKHRKHTKGLGLIWLEGECQQLINKPYTNST